MSQDNRKRAISEVASVDAWHSSFTQGRKEAAVHVDVAFTDGRIGEEPDSPVRFRLRLRRAEMVIVVPAIEPAKVVKSSVRRDAPSQSLEIKSSASATIGADLSMKMGPAPRLAAKLGLGKAKTSTIQRLERSTAFRVMQIQTPEGDYAWAISAVGDSQLEGRPWDAQKHWRLKVKDTRPTGSKSLPPQIHVELRCRREDFEITDIELKDGDDLNIPPKARLAAQDRAAEAIIRTRLAQSGLLRGPIEDRFATIVLAAIVAEGE